MTSGNTLDSTTAGIPRAAARTAAAVAIAAAAAFAAVAAIVHVGWFQPADEAVLHWLAARREPGIDRAMLAITSMADGIVRITLAAVAAAFLLVLRQPRMAALIIGIELGGKLLNAGLKAAFARDRPDFVELLDVVTSPAFPSGHAMGAVVIYGAIALAVTRLDPPRPLGFVMGTAAVLVIVAVGLSRSWLGVHYGSDVLAGWLAGMAWVAALSPWLQPRR